MLKDKLQLEADIFRGNYSNTPMKSSLLELRAQLIQILKLLKIDSWESLQSDIDQHSSMAVSALLLVFLMSVFYISWSHKVVNAPPNYKVGELNKISTHLGDIEIRKIGNFAFRSGKAVVCLNGINPNLGNEWITVAEKLGARGYRVIIIDFHSNAKTKPKMVWGGISDFDVHLIIKESVISHLLGDDKVILLGKSWGGRQAALFTQKYPNLVSRLGLVCPASSDESLVAGVKEANTPVYLAWARDDYVKWYSNVDTWKRVLGNAVEVQSADSGGHFILPEYTDRIVQFVTA